MAENQWGVCIIYFGSASTRLKLIAANGLFDVAYSDGSPQNHLHSRTTPPLTAPSAAKNAQFLSRPPVIPAKASSPSEKYETSLHRQRA